MTKAFREEPMNAKICYRYCDDGFNTHFGTQNSNECWCSIGPDLRKHGPELAPSGCDMLCAGTTVGEHCGGHDSILVYEITATRDCDYKAIEESTIQEGADPEDQQIIGRPWDYQERFDTTAFLSTQGNSPSISDYSGAGMCVVEDDNKILLDSVDVWKGAARTVPRILCGIYTHQNSHKTKVTAVKETWASHCDGFVAFSDVADLEIPTFKIKHEGPEVYDNMWQKSRAIWKYINFHYKDEFDWFLLGGDDLFVIVENLRKYLLSDGIKRAAGGLTNGGSNPMYLGRRMQAFGESSRMYNSGGASYLLNQASVGLLGGHLDDGACRPHTEKPWEDVLVSLCLQKHGVIPFDTRDFLGRERFHLFPPAVVFRYRRPHRPEDRVVSGISVDDWYLAQAIDLKFGAEGCSSDSISFHYIDEQLMPRLYHLIYSCPRHPGVQLVGPPGTPTISPKAAGIV